MVLALNLIQNRKISKREWIKKYREPDLRRKKLYAACEPIILPDLRQESEKCEQLHPLPPIEIHPYDKLLAQDLKNEWESSRMICIFHKNSMTEREHVERRNLFQHQDMLLRYYNTRCVHHYLTGTRFECLKQLFLNGSYHALLFSKEPNVLKMVKTAKKVQHHLVLLCAVVDDKILSYNEIIKYSELPNLPTLQSHLCHTLSLASQSITQNLAKPLTQLSMSLDQFVKQKEKETK